MTDNSARILFRYRVFVRQVAPWLVESQSRIVAFVDLVL